MVRLVYKYSISKRVSMEDVEESLMLAALAAESLHGRSALKIDAAFRLNKKTGICVIDAESQVGLDIARIFAGFLTKGFGEAAFEVEHTEERVIGNRIL